MHDIRFIRENPEAFDRALKRRGLPPEAERLIEIDARRRNLITGLGHAQARRNAVSKDIGEAKKKERRGHGRWVDDRGCELKDSY